MYEKSWDELSRKKQDLYLTLLWHDGHSEKAIAVFFDTTKNTVVRRRHHLKLSTSGRLEAKLSVDSERFRDLLDLHAMAELEATGVISIAPPVEPAPTCEWPLSTMLTKKPLPCGKPAVPGHHVCEQHLAYARTRGKRS